MVKSVKAKVKSKTYLLALIIVFILTAVLICGCMIYNHPTKHSPKRQPNTNWDSGRICFSVDSDLKCLGLLKTDSGNINVEILLGKGRDRSMTVEDYDAKVREDFAFNSERYLISGDCEFGKDNFTLKVKESSIDGINVDDEITFNLVEELPEWATM